MTSTSIRPVTELVIENVALSYLVDIKKQFLDAQRRKERAVLSESQFEFNRFYSSVENLLDMIKAKSIKNDSVVDSLIERLERLENSNKSIKDKIKELRQILRDTAQVIRKHRWFDMPQRSERGFNLVGEFYSEG